MRGLLDLEVSDPREDYLSLISIEKSRVYLSPPIIFLFGGKIDHLPHPPKSVRCVLYNHILTKYPTLSNSLVIPEDFKDWLYDSVYPDLLTFESDLAETSSLVIIALESPGSIAELGSFSMNGGLRKKIIIIISEYHHKQSSFITLGPLRLLPEENIFSYPYNHIVIADSFDYYLDDLVDNINRYLNGISKTENFNVKNNGHIALAMYELILMFKALKLNEIKDYLKIISISISTIVTKRLLFLLEKLSLITKNRLGNIDYYIPLKNSQRIKFSSKGPKKLFDRNTALLGVSQYYTSSRKEEMRKRVINKSNIEKKS